MESFFSNSITGESTLSGNYDMNRQNIGLRKENKRLRRAWMKAQQTGNIYSHVAYALARGCVDLVYVNVDSGEFIEYDTDEDHYINMKEYADRGIQNDLSQDQRRKDILCAHESVLDGGR